MVLSKMRLPARSWKRIPQPAPSGAQECESDLRAFMTNGKGVGLSHSLADSHGLTNVRLGAGRAGVMPGRQSSSSRLGPMLHKGTSSAGRRKAHCRGGEMQKQTVKNVWKEIWGTLCAMVTNSWHMLNCASCAPKSLSRSHAGVWKLSLGEDERGEMAVFPARPCIVRETQ